MQNPTNSVSGQGWTVDLVKKVLANGGKLEQFNSAYAKIFIRRPVQKQSKDALNCFFQEGAPEFSNPTLVPIAVAYAALN